MNHLENAVSIVTRLRDGRSEVRIPVGAKFFLLQNVHKIYGVHLVSYSICIRLLSWE